mgnify:CR=1 FL=1
MKKLLCVVLLGIMAFSTFAVAVPITASAAESQESVSATYGDFEYTLENDYTCTITGYNGSATNVTIPSTIHDYKVCKIGAGAFYDCSSLEKIIIPDSVKEICWSPMYGCFQKCNNLKEIYIGSGFEKSLFDMYTLSGCNSLEKIVFSEDNNYYCSIDGVPFDKSKTSICRYPAGKKDKEYTIPDTVSELSMADEFFYNENLKTIVIPKSVKSIGEYTFGTVDSFPITIKGYKGTAAEEYAKENGFKFIALDVSEPTSVSLNKTSLTLDVSKSYTLTKTVSPSNAVTSYTWSSSNTSVATVDGNGKVTAKKAGTATITVKTSNGKTATCKVTVNLPAPQITGLANTTGGIKISWNKVDGAYGYRLYYKPVSGGWKRFKDTTATSFTDSGVSPNRTETYTIRCIDKNGNTVSGYNSKGWSKKYVYNPPKSIKLNKTSAYIGKKESVTLKYTLSAGSTSTVTWSSSNKNVATVSGGKVTAKGAGATTITATTANGKKATCKVTVINGVRQYYTCTSGNRTIAEYSVVVPDGCYDKQSNAWRCYYEKYNYDKYDMGYVGAILFTKSPYSQSSPPAPNFTKLGEKNGYVFGYTTATGLEFIADDITSVKKYSTAHQTFNYAVKTFRFE